LRVSLGWVFFSAFLRRTVNVPSKLIPSSPEYVGGKLVTFLPHAWTPMRGLLEYVLLRPVLLYDFIIAFTVVEAVFGLFMILGFATRLSGSVLALLSWGIGAAAGWLGSTCVEEWQIAVMEGSAAAMFALTGSRWFSLDQLLSSKFSGGIRLGKIRLSLW
jgi:thiosulfate dehydrogenase [quinone] large subunit